MVIDLQRLRDHVYMACRDKWMCYAYLREGRYRYVGTCVLQYVYEISSVLALKDWVSWEINDHICIFYSAVQMA